MEIIEDKKVIDEKIIKDHSAEISAILKDEVSTEDFENTTYSDYSSSIVKRKFKLTAQKILRIAKGCWDVDDKYSPVFQQKNYQILKQVAENPDIEFASRKVKKSVINLLNTANTLFLIGEYEDEPHQEPDIFKMRTHRVIDTFSPELAENYFAFLCGHNKEGFFDWKMQEKFNETLINLSHKYELSERALFDEIYNRWVDGILSIDSKDKKALGDVLLEIKRTGLESLSHLMLLQKEKCPSSEQSFVDKMNSIKPMQEKLLEIYNATTDSELLNPMNLKSYEAFEYELCDRVLHFIAPGLFQTISKYKLYGEDIQAYAEKWKNKGNPDNMVSMIKLQTISDVYLEIIAELGKFLETISRKKNANFVKKMESVLKRSVFYWNGFYEKTLEKKYNRIHSKKNYGYLFQCIKESQETIKNIESRSLIINHQIGDE